MESSHKALNTYLNSEFITLKKTIDESESHLYELGANHLLGDILPFSILGTYCLSIQRAKRKIVFVFSLSIWGEPVTIYPIEITLFYSNWTDEKWVFENIYEDDRYPGEPAWEFEPMPIYYPEITLNQRKDCTLEFTHSFGDFLTLKGQSEFTFSQQKVTIRTRYFCNDQPLKTQNAQQTQILVFDQNEAGNYKLISGSWVETRSN